MRSAAIVAVLTNLTGMGPPMLVGKGVTCAPWSADGIIRRDPPTPVSFLAADLGKPGVPHLSLEQRRQVARFQNAQNRKTLRFVFLFDKGQPVGTHGLFVIYNATKGACAPGAMYNVLNGASNSFYQPAENPWNLGAMPGG
jgi:hypothetical protein